MPTIYCSHIPGLVRRKKNNFAPPQAFFFLFHFNGREKKCSYHLQLLTSCGEIGDACAHSVASPSIDRLVGKNNSFQSYSCSRELQLELQQLLYERTPREKVTEKGDRGTQETHEVIIKTENLCSENRYSIRRALPAPWRCAHFSCRQHGMLVFLRRICVFIIAASVH